MDTSFESLDDGTEESTSFRHILNTVTEKRELIIVINKADEKAVRKGLATLKGRDTQKLKSAGLVVGDDTLSFQAFPYKEDGKDSETKINLQITLAPRNGVVVYEMKIPDDKL